MSASVPEPAATPHAPEGEETLCCVGCGQVRPRAQMRWGVRPKGPVWFPATVRVLRCRECLPD